MSVILKVIFYSKGDAVVEVGTESGVIVLLNDIKCRILFFVCHGGDRKAQ